MARDPFPFHNQDYPLDHLTGFRVTVPAKDPLLKPAVLQVSFSCHVFSEKWEDGMMEDRRFQEGKEERAFCPVRYGCSINLRDLIEYHVGGKAFEGRDSKGARNHFFYAEADGIAYPIYFRLSRADNIKGATGVLHIISAYQNVKLKARHTFQAVKFARLVHQKCPPVTP